MDETTDRYASPHDLLSGCTIDIAGLPVRVRADDGERAATVEYLSRYPPATGPAKLSIFYGAHPPANPHQAAPDYDQDGSRIWFDGDTLRLDWQDRLGLSATPTAITIGVPDRELVQAVHYILPFALAHSLAFHGRLLLRGGVVFRERALLILGSKGAGKSTTVLAALRHGWKALSDDFAVVGQEGGELKAWGIMREFHLPDDILAESEKTTALHQRAAYAQQKRWIVDSGGPGWSKESRRLAGTVVLTHGTTERCRSRRMRRRAVRNAALRSWPPGLGGLVGGLPPSSVAPQINAVCRLPAYEVPLSSTSSSRLDDAAKILDEVELKIARAAGA